MAFNYRDYDEIVNAQNQLNQHNANKVQDWNGGTYGQKVQDTMSKIENREKFSYDLNGDALYQQYKDKYMTQGKLAMADTIGQASALTGGYGNSYATSAGYQAYQGYLQNLNDVVPELYQLALNKYQMEGDELNNQLSMYNNAYNTEYGQYRDKVGDWYNEASRLQSAYDSEYNKAFSNYQQSVSEAQHAASLAAQKEANAKAVASRNKNTDLFDSVVMTENEFSQRSASKQYDSYSKYIDAQLEKWYKEDKLSEAEVAYLKAEWKL